MDLLDYNRGLYMAWGQGGRGLAGGAAGKGYYMHYTDNVEPLRKVLSKGAMD